MDKCDSCNGSGTVTTMVETQSGETEVTQECGVCGGSGEC